MAMTVIHPLHRFEGPNGETIGKEMIESWLSCVGQGQDKSDD